MKSTKDFRNDFSADNVRKAVKLEPNRKSGKERHTIYKSLSIEDEDEEDYKALHKRESILDYIDDEDEDIDYDEDDEDFEDDLDEDYDDEEDDFEDED